MSVKEKEQEGVTGSECIMECAKDTNHTSFNQVGNTDGKKREETMAYEVLRLFDAVVECLKIYLFLLSSSDLNHVNATTKKLMIEVENLQIHDKSSKSAVTNPERMIPEGLEATTDDDQKKRSREEVMAERKAKAAVARARKVAAAEAKKALKQSNATAKGSKIVKKVDDQEIQCGSSNTVEQQPVNQFRLMKDPGLPGNFRLSQPFRTVHFDLPPKDEGSVEGPSNKLSFCETVAPNIHPSFVEFATRCGAKHIVGIDAVCVAFVQAFKQFLSSYTVTPNQTISRDLDQAIRQQLSYLTENGKNSFPSALGNLIRQLKKEINQLKDSITEEEGKNHLYDWLDDFVQQNFELAFQAISSFCLMKMKNTPVVLTYSWCPVVERIILDAHNEKLLFRVHVLDSPIEHRGRQLVKTLCERKIQCSYGMLSAVAYLMKECQMVLLGCSAILSNGFAVADRGTSQVALVASASNIPVLVAAQTCKFVDRVQSFSRGMHEISALMSEKQEVVPADLITAVITELRILPPSSAPAVLKAKQLGIDS